MPGFAARSRKNAVAEKSSPPSASTQSSRRIDLEFIKGMLETLPTSHVKSLRRYVENFKEREPENFVILASVPPGHGGDGIVVASPRLSPKRFVTFSVSPTNVDATSMTLDIEEGARPTTVAFSIPASSPSTSGPARFAINAEGVTPVDADGHRRGAPDAVALMKKRFESIRTRLLDEGLATPEVAARLRLTSEGVRKKATRKELLAIKLGRDYRFPRWQFDDRTRDGVTTGMREVLGASILDPLELAAWFTKTTDSLGGRTPIEALRSGDLEDVIAAAEAAGVS